MLSQLLEGRRKLKPKIPSKKSKGKRKEGEKSSSAHTEEEGQSNFESSKPSSEEEGNSENESTHSKRMNKLGSIWKPSLIERPLRSRSGLAVPSRMGPCPVPS